MDRKKELKQLYKETPVDSLIQDIDFFRFKLEIPETIGLLRTL